MWLSSGPARDSVSDLCKCHPWMVDLSVADGPRVSEPPSLHLHWISLIQREQWQTVVNDAFFEKGKSFLSATPKTSITIIILLPSTLVY